MGEAPHVAQLLSQAPHFPFGSLFTICIKNPSLQLRQISDALQSAQGLTQVEQSCVSVSRKYPSEQREHYETTVGLHLKQFEAVQ